VSFAIEYSSPNSLIIKTSFSIEEISKVNVTLNIIIRSISDSIGKISVNWQYELIELFECDATKSFLIDSLEKHLNIFVSEFTE
jgi:hypothetical protein